MIPEGRRRLTEELPGLTRLHPPPAAWGAPAAAPSLQEELRALLRRQRPPPPPPLPHIHLPSLLCHIPALSSLCPPCRRREKVRSQMSPYEDQVS